MNITLDENNIYHFPKTQGQRKVVKRLKELFNNELFLKEIDEVLEIKNERNFYNKVWKLARKYNLKFESGTPLFDYIYIKKYDKEKELNLESLDKNIENDVCIIRDDADGYLNEVFPRDFEIPPGKKQDSRLEINNYPIRVSISPQATKRDLLDFINKRWKYIADLLSDYDQGIILERKRKKQERDDLIWKNRNKPRKEIADLINKKFPNENLTYSDVNSIIYYLSFRDVNNLQ